MALRGRATADELFRTPRLAEAPRQGPCSRVARGEHGGEAFVYTVRPPSARGLPGLQVSICIDPGEQRLYVIEPLHVLVARGDVGLDDALRVIGVARRYMLVAAEEKGVSVEAGVEEVTRLVLELLRENRVLRRLAAALDPSVIAYYVVRDTAGFDVVEPLIADRSHVEDIVAARPGLPVKVVGRFPGGLRSLETNIVLGEDDINSIIESLVARTGRSVSLAEPLASVMIEPGGVGFRFTASYGREATVHGPSFVIRVFPEPWNLLRQLLYRGLQPAVTALLGVLVERKRSMLIVGVMSSGKTSMLNSLASFIPRHATVVTIEDTPEIVLPHPYWIRHVTREARAPGARGEITMFDLVKHALRESADYLIIGEVRGEEGRVWAQAIATGHGGLTTFHAEGPGAALARMVSEPISAEPALLSALNIIATVRRDEYGHRFLHSIADSRYAPGASGLPFRLREMARVEARYTGRTPAYETLLFPGTRAETRIPEPRTPTVDTASTGHATASIEEALAGTAREAARHAWRLVEALEAVHGGYAVLESLWLEAGSEGYRLMARQAAIAYTLLELLYTILQLVAQSLGPHLDTLAPRIGHEASARLVWGLMEQARSLAPRASGPGALADTVLGETTLGKCLGAVSERLAKLAMASSRGEAGEKLLALSLDLLDALTGRCQ